MQIKATWITANHDGKALPVHRQNATFKHKHFDHIEIHIHIHFTSFTFDVFAQTPLQPLQR